MLEMVARRDSCAEVLIQIAPVDAALSNGSIHMLGLRAPGW